MTKKELLTYYRENKNITDEIVLVGKFTGIEKIFRKYIEVFTGDDKWLAIKEGVMFNTEDLLSSYRIPNTFDVFSVLKIGDTIQTISKGGSLVYYKKIDSDAFIECDKNGHIDVNRLPLKSYYLYSHEEIITLSECYEKNEGV